MLNHEGHIGLNKCKLHAKESDHWPGLNISMRKWFSIINFASSIHHLNASKSYNVFRSGDSITPLIQAMTDICHFEGASHFVRLWINTGISCCAQVIFNDWATCSFQCNLIFSEYGWPETLIFDNGPCYTVESFTSVMNVYNVNHISNSPHYPQSDELAEKYVQTVKRILQDKTRVKDLFKCLMIYCNTPLSGRWQSPMQILQSRSTRSDLTMYNTARQQLVYSLKSLEIIRLHIYLHMTNIGKKVMY